MKLEIPYAFISEYKSTVEAREILHKISPKYSHRKLLIDQVAACVILDRFLNENYDPTQIHNFFNH